jgi:hypothetical protein
MKPKEENTVTEKEGIQKMLATLSPTTGVLTSSEIHPAIPLIHEVGHREGCRLLCDTPVRHCGWGLFVAEVSGKKFSFDGGGAMRRCNGFSWTPLRFDEPGFEELGYDVNAVRAALEQLLA